MAAMKELRHTKLIYSYFLTSVERVKCTLLFLWSKKQHMKKFKLFLNKQIWGIQIHLFGPLNVYIN